jgi:uncharacterized membrane protein (UPF0127 family)
MKAVSFRAALLSPILLLSLLIGCQSSTQPNSNLPTTRMTLGSKQFTIEIANTDSTREFGLMKRDSMPADHGMIFVFGDERPQAFWMKNTRIDLDIVFINNSGKVVSIKQMQAYDLRSVPSDAPVRYAIELNLNAAADAGIKVGDHVDIPTEAKESKD